MAKVILVGGLGFGDESKGSCIDHYTRENNAELVVKYSGGSNCGHNVVLPDGTHHTFSQFGSGTFAGAATYLSQHVVFNPPALLSECNHLEAVGIKNPIRRVAIHEDCLVTTPYHLLLNKIRETLRGDSCHGSTGTGLNETKTHAEEFPGHAIRVRDLKDHKVLREKLLAIRGLTSPVNLEGANHPSVKEYLEHFEDPHLLDDFIVWCLQVLDAGLRIVDSSYLQDQLKEKEVIIFEGSQGALLDQEWGFHPHVTRSNCTFENALDLLQGFTGPITKLGVIRAYHTRHGAGPFPTQCKCADTWIEPHNQPQTFQGNFRVGYFDSVLARLASDIMGPLDGIIVSHLDQIVGPQKVCTHYDISTKPFYRLRKDARSVYLMLKKMFDKEGDPYIHLVETATPKYTTIPSRDLLLEWISGIFETPVVLTSNGPTYKDKHA